MNYSKETIRFVDDLIISYAKFDAWAEQYNIDTSELSILLQEQFASHIMKDNESFASEATGPDNKFYNQRMLPSLLNHMSKPYDKDTLIEFTSTWRNCVVSYCEESMSAILEERLSNYNSYRGAA